MDLYSLLLFLHLTFVIVWLGSGVLLHVLAFRFDRAGDAAGMAKLFESTAALSAILFIPAALLVVLSGVALTIDGPWSFGMLWIVLGLAGFALSFLTGALWIGPQSERIKQLMGREGGMGTDSRRAVRRMLVVARIDYVVLFLVVFDMAMKPTGEDVGTLVLMAAILASAATYLLWRARAIGAVEPAPQASA